MTSEAPPAPPPEPPRPTRQFGLFALLGTGLVSATFAVGALLVAQHLSPPRLAVTAPEPPRQQFQCPMHPSVVQDHPGECPICGMKLVKVEGEKPAGRKLLFYRSPMDPKQTSPGPMKDSMGMDYLPVYEEDEAPTAPAGGLATVRIDPERQQLIGLTTAEVTQGAIGSSWRTVGQVAVDETRVRRINVKVPGFVERVFVDFVGKPVKRGEPLFSMYSPELLAAQQEYLLALRTRSALSKGGMAADGDSLAAAARRKLSLWDVPEPEIARIAQSGEATKVLTFFSPISGAVTRKDIVEGMRLEAGAMPYEIVDLSTVWVLADVYESELREVRAGMPARLDLNAFPGREFKGQVSFIDPLLDPKTRTVKVRMSFANPAGDLRPGMFGEAVLYGAARQGLHIPADAVIDSGTEAIVFLAVAGGKFQPRRVKLGATEGSRVEVVDGLAAGERVVTRANFLVDSESRLRASLAELGAKAAPGTPESSLGPPDASALAEGAKR